MNVLPRIIARVTGLMLSRGPVEAKRMFGGFGLYIDGAMFAIVAGDTLYLKADGDTAPRFEGAGAKRFTYVRQGRPASLNFWALPDRMLDDGAAFLPWADLALAAARRALRERTAKKRRAP